ncbi:MAG: hypothetical protein NC318_10095 [Blautia sp.]|nr:hypothetical protein [Lachnoclostridium sp.]MCM1211943.1 hypothetical protein [Blautia sp.]
MKNAAVLSLKAAEAAFSLSAGVFQGPSQDFLSALPGFRQEGKKRLMGSGFLWAPALVAVYLDFGFYFYYYSRYFPA